MNFGAYLKIQREDRGWTQPVAAEKIGIEQSYLSKLELGKATPSEEMFERIITAYEINTTAMARDVDLSDLERLREIGAVRDMVRRIEGKTSRTRRSWLLAGMIMVALGGAILSFVITERRYGDTEWAYVSKGIILEGESDFVFADINLKSPKMNPVAAECPEDALCTQPVTFVEDPIMKRVHPQYLFIGQYRGAYFAMDVEGGRRVFEEAGKRRKPETLNIHVFHALAVALLLGGLASFYTSRRW